MSDGKSQPAVVSSISRAQSQALVVSTKKSNSKGASTKSSELFCNAIAQRAYEKFLARGGEHGHDLQDWIAAERELLAESLRS